MKLELKAALASWLSLEKQLKAGLPACPITTPVAILVTQLSHLKIKPEP